MSNIIAFSPKQAAACRVESEYVTAWSDYYAACRSTMDRQHAINLADSHVAYLKKRDAEVLAGVAKAMGEPA